MPTTYNRPTFWGELIPRLTPSAVTAAVLAGAVIASVGLTVQEQFPQVERRDSREPAQLQRERKRTHELLNKIERALANPVERSAAPMRTAVTVSRPSHVAAAAPVTVPLSGVWSPKAEMERQARRDWIDAEIRRRQE